MSQMIGSVVLPDTEEEEWPQIKSKIKKRIGETFGNPLFIKKIEVPQYDEMDRYLKHGLIHIRIRYHILDDEWNEAVCILPENISSENPAQGILVIHETNGKLGRYGNMDPENISNRAYALELSKRGYVTFSPDQFGFGSTIKNINQDELYVKFYKKYPDWSLDGRRLLEQKRALDVMEKMNYIKGNVFGTIGNSLGGRAVIHLAALDERIGVAVCSTGISPNHTNVFRSIARDSLLNPKLGDEIKKNGKMPWEYHEMIALCAPRPLLILEPFNDEDGCNPDIMPTFECIYNASHVYKLLGHPERLVCIVHGDGHDTTPDGREYAYRFIERFLSSPKY